MTGGRNTDFWRVLRPSAWPKPPLWMSFSTLVELETCPRRWALTAAEYSDIWKYRGYPSAPQPSALEGTIVHMSLQKITGALVERACPSLVDASAILTMRELGGYTSIIMGSLEQALLPYKENPRAASALEGIRQRLTAQVPGLRTKVQRFLSRIRPEPRAISPEENVICREGKSRHPLQNGCHAEVKLQASELGWHGFADMLTLSTTRCEIRDFKTGAPKEQHKGQLWTYALLWARDGDLNPSGQLADKLVLSYEDSDIEVPALDAGTLLSFEDELKARTAAALTNLQCKPPEPRLSPENCMFCAVRHLCEEYWHWHIQSGANGESPKGMYADAQIKLVSKHGPCSWDCIVESGPIMEVGSPMLLRAENLAFDLHPGQRLRLLNVYISEPGEKEHGGERHPLIIATMGALSEAFLLSI